MKSTTNHVGMACVVIVAVLCAVALVFHNSSSEESKSPVATAEESSANGRRTTPSEEVNPVQPVNRREQLYSRAEIFIKAYYDIAPDDTENSHRSNIRRDIPFISKSLLKKFYFGIEETRSPVNQKRWNNKLSLRAEVNTSKLRIVAAGQDSSTKLVYVPVMIATIRPSGRIDDTYEMQTASKWRYGVHGWKLLGFTEYSEDSDAL